MSEYNYNFNNNEDQQNGESYNGFSTDTPVAAKKEKKHSAEAECINNITNKEKKLSVATVAIVANHATFRICTRWFINRYWTIYLVMINYFGMGFYANWLRTRITWRRNCALCNRCCVIDSRRIITNAIRISFCFGIDSAIRCICTDREQSRKQTRQNCRFHI